MAPEVAPHIVTGHTEMRCRHLNNGSETLQIFYVRGKLIRVSGWMEIAVLEWLCCEELLYVFVDLLHTESWTSMGMEVVDYNIRRTLDMYDEQIHLVVA